MNRKARKRKLMKARHHQRQQIDRRMTVIEEAREASKTSRRGLAHEMEKRGYSAEDHHVVDLETGKTISRTTKWIRQPMTAAEYTAAKKRRKEKI